MAATPHLDSVIAKALPFDVIVERFDDDIYIEAVDIPADISLSAATRLEELGGAKAAKAIAAVAARPEVVERYVEDPRRSVARSVITNPHITPEQFARVAARYAEEKQPSAQICAEFLTEAGRLGVDIGAVFRPGAVAGGALRLVSDWYSSTTSRSPYVRDTELTYSLREAPITASIITRILAADKEPWSRRGTYGGFGILVAAATTGVPLDDPHLTAFETRLQTEARDWRRNQAAALNVLAIRRLDAAIAAGAEADAELAAEMVTYVAAHVGVEESSYRRLTEGAHRWQAKQFAAICTEWGYGELACEARGRPGEIGKRNHYRVAPFILDGVRLACERLGETWEGGQRFWVNLELAGGAEYQTGWAQHLTDSDVQDLVDNPGVADHVIEAVLDEAVTGENLSWSAYAAAIGDRDLFSAEWARARATSSALNLKPSAERSPHYLAGMLASTHWRVSAGRRIIPHLDAAEGHWEDLTLNSPVGNVETLLGDVQAEAKEHPYIDWLTKMMRERIDTGDRWEMWANLRESWEGTFGELLAVIELT